MYDADVAWAAGFIDGEGYIALQKARNSFAPLIVVNQAGHRDCLVKLQTTLGGSVSVIARPTVTGKTVYRWVWQSAPQMREHLPNLVTHMTVKRQQAELLLDYVQRMGVRGRRLTDEEIAQRATTWRRLAELRGG